ncbi:hypothetical protein [Mycolicibacterium celeriflavum]|uniref:Uncharacterized protein n=1 Tax=Mycolicibacterium celeriflavum TaxID=1249101 RepID=A0A1X0BN30_MYCCF|nr:hypothetical protein [Mycolicibacterium celeriflavum]MCV7240287.1 hypothetical protein [Mycolicibacterium celeriflavum]ORA44378.1 hypothetical protein BST21_19645 [Mycolicibacterium celeriflavum]BBY44368.1 hypothetical protein MCEL_26630 [Mycolicibacterium celeriflavum]
MALTWWPVAVVGFACLAGAVALAVFVPTKPSQRQLRPLANTTRLTRLPEYARVARARTVSLIVTIALLVLLFGAAALASARPSGLWWSMQTSDVPEDIMLCVGQPATEPTTGEFLSHFAEQARTYGTQRIGLTSANRRVIPLTRDHQFAVEKLGEAAGLAELPDDGALSPTQLSAKRNALASFTAPVTYVDYAASVADVLALCLAGFPADETPDERRRSLIYLGPGQLRAADETRPSLFTEQQVTEMARERGVQVNALVTSPGPLRSVVEATYGRYAPIRTDLAAQLDGIRAHPPDADRAATLTGFRGDTPTIPLAAAVAVSALLCLSLAVLRR